MLKKLLIVAVIIVAVIGIVIASIWIKNRAILNNQDNVQETFTEINQNFKEEELERIVVVLNKNKKETSNKQEASAKKEDIEQQEQKVIEQQEENNNTIEEKPVEVKKLNYYIKVNYLANVVNIYTLDENNEYTVPYKAFICSTGTATPTEGCYKISNKYRWLGLFGDVYGQYCSQIVGNILFHSVPYLEKNNSASLEYWEYDKLGESCSMGCIRLTVADSKWIYDNCQSGTTVEFYSDENPGPFGKPTSMKISDNEECKNWDPTDNTEGNPWNNYN